MTAYMDHKDLANETISDDRAREIADGAHRVLDLIARTEFTSGREEGSVTLLAATKTRDVGEIMAAIDAGVHMIGENRPQEVIAKIDGLRYACLQRGIVLGASDMQTVASLDETDDPEALDRLPLHLIGQLQSNKIGKMLPDVNTIRSRAVRPRASRRWVCCSKSTSRASPRSRGVRPTRPSNSRCASRNWRALSCRD